ncbi:MAG: hypothetical protein IJR26_07300 [Bacteroidales bacterium]|nr:hypothetical protein [Bacteroidales bacterium]
MTTNDRLKYEHFYGLIERHKALIERLCMRRSSGDSYHCAVLRQECYITIWKHKKQIGTDLSPLRESWHFSLVENRFLVFNQENVRPYLYKTPDYRWDAIFKKSHLK